MANFAILTDHVFMHSSFFKKTLKKIANLPFDEEQLSLLKAQLGLIFEKKKMRLMISFCSFAIDTIFFLA